MPRLLSPGLDSLLSLSAAGRLSSSLSPSLISRLSRWAPCQTVHKQLHFPPLQIRPAGTQRLWQDHAAQVHCGNPEDLTGEDQRAGEAPGVPRTPGARQDGGLHAAGNDLCGCKGECSDSAFLSFSSLVITYAGEAAMILRQKLQSIPLVQLLVFTYDE